MTNNKKPNEKSKLFSVDSDSSQLVEVPSITKLLKRKSFKKEQPDSTAPESTSKPESTNEPESEPESENEPTVLVHTKEAEKKRQAKIQPAKRRGETSDHLNIWDRHTLQSSQDPLGKAILILLNKGLKSAVFLAVESKTMTSKKDASEIPTFMSSAAVEPKDRLSLWTGLSWDPRVVPELWNQLIKTGYIELPPPGSMTNQKSTRNVVRGSFGLTGIEWLLLVKIGSKTAIRGLLAIISEKTVLRELEEVLPLLSQ